jgi:Flp pilus assembly CpaF family ATPase
MRLNERTGDLALVQPRRCCRFSILRRLTTSPPRPISILIRARLVSLTFSRLSFATGPDRIIVSEIRGPEARVFLDALNTGHRGSLTTIHANSAGDALRRLAQLAMRGSGGGVPLHDVEEEYGRSIDVIVHVMNEDGWRHVTEIRLATSG